MNFNENIAHVVYASDDRFAEILGVSIVSLYENSKDMDDIILYILDCGIADGNKKKLLSVAKKYGRTMPLFMKAKNIEQELQMDVIADRGSLGQYARLFVSSILPENLGRVLYLDCDTIINHSISELWSLDLKGRTVGALMDAFSKYYRKNIDLEPDDIMFNTGVMLINLNRWKEEKVEEKMLEFIAGRHGKIQQADQGALNAVLSHDVYCFEPRFNSLTIFYDFTYGEMWIYRKPPKFYTMEQIDDAVNKPVIIHFTTSFLSKRPWMEGCRHKYVDQWLRYKQMSPWKDEKLWQDNRTAWKKVGIKLLEMLPHRFMVRIAGIAQAYGRPVWNRIRQEICGRHEGNYINS